MSAGAAADEDFAAVAVVWGCGDVVEDAPAGDHVEFVAVVLDVRDTAVKVGRRCGREGTHGIVEVRGGGAEGVDFLLRVKICKMVVYAVYLDVPISRSCRWAGR